MAMRLSVLSAGRLYPPGKFHVLISVRGWVEPRAIVRLEWVRSIEKSNDLIGIRIRDLPACSIVPQPTTLPCASRMTATLQINNRVNETLRITLSWRSRLSLLISLNISALNRFQNQLSGVEFCMIRRWMWSAKWLPVLEVPCRSLLMSINCHKSELHISSEYVMSSFNDDVLPLIRKLINEKF
jgi:hypothetical protein